MVGKMVGFTFTSLGILILFTVAPMMITGGNILAGAAATGEQRERDRVGSLPGQPTGHNVEHFAGYVSLGRGLPSERHIFYYYVEAPAAAAQAPLLLWFSVAGMLCSSLGQGGMLEVGPLRVQRDMTLQWNQFSWHKQANLLFVDLPAGVGFSYYSDNEYTGGTNTTKVVADEDMVEDALSFLSRWLRRFPENRARDLYVAGERYGARYAVHLALYSPPNIRIKGLLLGNPLMDLESAYRGFIDYLTALGMLSEAGRHNILVSCDPHYKGSVQPSPSNCGMALKKEARRLGRLDVTALHEPLCASTNHPTSGDYVARYMNIPAVQEALHANLTGRVPGPWLLCNDRIRTPVEESWSMIAAMKEVVGRGGMKVMVFNGDAGAEQPVTSTNYAVRKVFNGTAPTSFGPWYDSSGVVGGYLSVYGAGENVLLTFATVRGAGGYVASNQPLRAKDLFASFLNEGIN
ncbi:unnamed protein product [Linum trigynum]|uniref:Serine carboxypeptidase n=2 Tax=Linum trigynum TaxID=586398 RepID=A0AAV2FCW3_9ROSI